MRSILFAALLTAAVIPCPAADASGPGFDPRIIVFGEARQQIRATPIEKRPSRPLHVYGNAVRRRQSRGVEASQR